MKRKMKDIFFEFDVQCLEKLHEFHNDFSFLPERMKTEKVQKLVPNLHNKTEYVIHIKNLNQTLNYGLALKKFIERLNLIEMVA